MTRTTHRQLLVAGIIVLLIPIGLVCRFVPIGLPQAIVKYGGSFLWAAMVYWMLALVLPRLRPLHLGLCATAVAAGVEFFKRVSTPGLNAFRDTFAGKVLLGRYFSYTDIAVYILAIACATWIDHRVLASPRHRMHQESE